MSIQFNGVAANNVDMGSNRDYFRNVSGGTMMAWVTYGLLGVARTVIGVSVGTGTGTRAKFSSTVTDGVDFRVRALDADTSAVIATAGGLLTTGSRYHIACVVDYTVKTGFIYIDGELVTTGVFTAITAGNTSNTSAQTGTIGANEPGNNNPWAGQIEDPRVYNRLLGPAEIKTIYTARGCDNILDGLFARWTFNEFAPGVNAGSIPDISGNNNIVTGLGTLPYVPGTLKLSRPKHMAGARR
jgi:hypothetical protein